MELQKLFLKHIPSAASPCKNLLHGQQSFCVPEICEREVLKLSLNSTGTPQSRVLWACLTNTVSIDLQHSGHVHLRLKPLPAPSDYFCFLSNYSDAKCIRNAVSRMKSCFCSAERSLQTGDCLSLAFTFPHCFLSSMALAFLITQYQLQDVRGGGRIWRRTMHPMVYLLYHGCCWSSNARMLANKRWGLMLRNLTVLFCGFVWLTRLLHRRGSLSQALWTPY